EHRRLQGGRLRKDGRRGGESIRPHRHSRQQRRHLGTDQADHRYVARRMAGDARYRPDRNVAGNSRRAAGHGQAGLRQHHQHLVRRGTARFSDALAVRGGEVGNDRADADGGRRMGSAWHPMQLHLPRRNRGRTDRTRDARAGRGAQATVRANTRSVRGAGGDEQNGDGGRSRARRAIPRARFVGGNHRADDERRLRQHHELSAAPAASARCRCRALKWLGEPLRQNGRVFYFTHANEKSMKTATSFALSLAAAVLIALASATIAAAAGSETCAGLNATIGGTCTPLLNSSIGGTANSAFGFDALVSNTTGDSNTATGYSALAGNTTGNSNTATGANALEYNTTGGGNTATGANALEYNETGVNNTATGLDALYSNTVGNNNIGVGYNAGSNLTAGSNNIAIGNEGDATDANTIRIGTQGTQTDTFIAGIFGTPKIKKACEVVVESTGLVGCVKSSARYKRDISDMGDASDKLM